MLPVFPERVCVVQWAGLIAVGEGGGAFMCQRRMNGSMAVAGRAETEISASEIMLLCPGNKMKMSGLHVGLCCFKLKR